MNIRDKEILKIAVPSIVSNITVPLLGLIDVAIVGHMGSAAYIGAVCQVDWQQPVWRRRGRIVIRKD